MWNIIINLIYEQSYERFLSEALSVEVQLTGALPDWGIGVVMREDLASSSFLALIVVSLIVVCAGFLALGIWNPISGDPGCGRFPALCAVYWSAIHARTSAEMPSACVQTRTTAQPAKSGHWLEYPTRSGLCGKETFLSGCKLIHIPQSVAAVCFAISPVRQPFWKQRCSQPDRSRTQIAVKPKRLF
jgi:hypothetical protein